MPTAEPSKPAEPVILGAEPEEQGRWTTWLVLWIRAMAVVAMLRGLLHWADVIGIGASATNGFEAQMLQWKVATVFFAVIELVAAVGLWLAAPWGAVVWLVATASTVLVEILFPQIFGGRFLVVVAEILMLLAYGALAFLAAREQDV